MSDDSVNHPKHYNSHPSGVECINVVEHFGFSIGNAVKYLWRAGLKGDALEDLEKARWYVDREIQRLRGAGGERRQDSDRPAAAVDNKLSALAAREERQARCSEWVIKSFGVPEAASVQHRAIRLLEEAIEAFQAAWVGSKSDPRDKAHWLVNSIFDRPVGDLQQELGGVAVTLLALAAAAGISADECEQRELTRCLTSPPDKFQKRNAEKNAAGFKGDDV